MPFRGTVSDEDELPPLVTFAFEIAIFDVSLLSVFLPTGIAMETPAVPLAEKPLTAHTLGMLTVVRFPSSSSTAS